MSPRLRKFALTAHVTTSVGWLGAIVGSLALAIAGLTSQDPETVRGVYVALELTGWFVLVPLSLASLLTGIVQSLGTKWGLFRHYWVLAKLVINLLATVILLLYTQTLSSLADVARNTAEASGDPSPVLHAGVGLLLLLGATTLAVYKPRGLTRHGQRKQREQCARDDAVRAQA
jgi:hypothetical protein